MKNLVAGLAVTVIACTAAQTPPASPVPQTAPPPAQVVDKPGPPVAGPPAAPAVGPPAAPVGESADNGLNELAAMTFGCPKAALNAAASAAAKVPSEGTYQFAYFGIVSDSHHAMYEVHFKSNYQSEAPLRYCVAIYCQQGWDPKTTQPLVTLIDDTKHAPTSKAPASHCSDKAMHAGALRKP
jgi:hypothetical protein